LEEPINNYFQNSLTQMMRMKDDIQQEQALTPEPEETDLGRLERFGLSTSSNPYFRTSFCPSCV